MSSGLFLMMMILLALGFFAMRGHRMLGVGGGAQQLSNGGHPSHGLEPRMSDAARTSLDADITRFGDELRELDLDVVGYDLDKEAQARYSEALDAYENAKQAMNMAQLASDATAVAHILEEGRLAMACVRAGARGEPMPQRRPPCFFDPSHGPSTRDVMWTPDGGAPREVPACALDAARVTSGAAPHIRMVQLGHQAVPYWQDQGHAAYARGYYEPYMGNQMVDGMVKGALVFGGLSMLMGLLDD